VTIARRFVVRGRVQGVGFRWFVQEAATRAGVTGWVRNLPDGDVEALVEGETSAVARVEAALRSGPRSARVDRVRIDEEQPAGCFTAFSIR
jgi:acylphosphatase